MTIIFKRINENAILPRRATDGSAGFDLFATQNCILWPGASALIASGISMAIPPGFCGMIWPRSGMATRHAIDRLAGLIDSDYRGEVMISLINHGDRQVEIKRGDRIAQLVVTSFLPDWEERSDLPDPGTRWGGFGSTGL